MELCINQVYNLIKKIKVDLTHKSQHTVVNTGSSSNRCFSWGPHRYQFLAVLFNIFYPLSGRECKLISDNFYCCCCGVRGWGVFLVFFRGVVLFGFFANWTKIGRVGNKGEDG